MKRTARNLGLLALLGAAGGVLGGVIALLIYRFGRTAGGTDHE